MKKDYCPGFFTLATGGLVGECEQDDESAYREVKEEIGLTDFQLQKIKVLKFEDERSRCFTNVYLLRNFNPEVTPLTLQKDEVDEVQYWSLAEIDTMIKNGSTKLITPDSLMVYEDLRKNGIF